MARRVANLETLAAMLPTRAGRATVGGVVLAGLVGVSSCDEGSIQSRVRQDTIQIVQAAVAWADSSQLRPASAPVVVLERSVSQRARSPAEFPQGGISRSEPLQVPLRRAIESSAGLRHVLVCAHDRGPRADQLCGRDPPWLVVNLSLPRIEGDSAVISVDLLPVEDRYSGGAGFLLLLAKVGEKWEVADVGHFGEID